MNKKSTRKAQANPSMLGFSRIGKIKDSYFFNIQSRNRISYLEIDGRAEMGLQGNRFREQTEEAELFKFLALRDEEEEQEVETASTVEDKVAAAILAETKNRNQIGIDYLIWWKCQPPKQKDSRKW